MTAISSPSFLTHDNACTSPAIQKELTPPAIVGEEPPDLRLARLQFEALLSSGNYALAQAPGLDLLLHCHRFAPPEPGRSDLTRLDELAPPNTALDLLWDEPPSLSSVYEQLLKLGVEEPAPDSTKELELRIALFRKTIGPEALAMIDVQADESRKDEDAAGDPAAALRLKHDVLLSFVSRGYGVDHIAMLLRGLHSSSLPASAEPNTPSIAPVVLAEGDPAIGHIEVLWQTHWSDEARTNKRCHEEIAESQLRILKHLLAKQPKFVFVEGLSRTIKPEDSDQETPKPLLRRLFGLVPIPTELSVIQKDFLAAAGAAKVYAALVDDVTLLPTCTPEEENETRKLQSWDLNHVFLVREQQAVRELKAFLAANQGRSVTLVYGGLHWIGSEDFAAHESMPRITARDFSGGGSPAGAHEFSYRILRAEDSAAQFELVRKAPAIFCFVFQSIRSDQAQHEALKKLIVPSCWTDEDKLRFSRLLEEAEMTDSVRAQLRERLACKTIKGAGNQESTGQ